MSDDTQDTLTDKQRLAITLLVQGQTDVEVGEAVGVTRETVNRWRNNGHDVFTVALNAARAEVWKDAHDRLRVLVSDAVTVLAGSVRSETPDVKVALAVLRLAGVKDIGKPVGAVTLEALENERRRDEMMRLMDAVL